MFSSVVNHLDTRLASVSPLGSYPNNKGTARGFSDLPSMGTIGLLICPLLGMPVHS